MYMIHIQFIRFFFFFWSCFFFVGAFLMSCVWRGKSLAEVGDQIAKAFPKMGCARELECTGEMGRPGQVGWSGQQVECQCQQLECPGWVGTHLCDVSICCETLNPQVVKLRLFNIPKPPTFGMIFPGPRCRRLATRANEPTVEASEWHQNQRINDGNFLPPEVEPRCWCKEDGGGTTQIWEILLGEMMQNSA